MFIRTCAEFQTDLPDDAIEEDHEIVQFSGRAVAEAICGMLEGGGYNSTKPEHQHEHGWDFEVRLQKLRIWIQISDLGNVFILISKCYAGLFPPRHHETVYAEVLTCVNDGLAADPRFSNVRWQMQADLLRGGPGADAPTTAS